MRALRWLLTLGVVGAAVLAVAWVRTEPEGPPPRSTSAVRLRPGPHPVASTDRTFVDTSRPTPAHGDFPGAPERTLVGTLWYPADDAGAHPLAVYSHGFMSFRSGGQYLAEHLASYGYVVVAVDYPATNFSAPGGPNVADVGSQPGDVSFVLDRVLGWREGERPFPGRIDPERIGVFGLSLGGLTTTLVAFHPRLRDPRVAAAISIAGPGSFFTSRYFANADVPFLMIAGTADAMVAFGPNAAPVPERVRDGGLLTVAGATHAGFSQMASGVMRLLGNPDALGCRALMGNLPVRADGAAPPPQDGPFASLGGAADGLDLGAPSPLPCAAPPPDEALAAGRQHDITTLAVRAFFESRFAETPEARRESASYLARTLPADYPETSFEPGHAGLPATQAGVGTRGASPAAR